MTLVEVRDAIVTRVEAPFKAAFTDIPLVHDNAPFDLNNPPERFVELEIEFHDGHQIGVAVNPRTRYQGYVYVTVNTKEGLGVRASLNLLDWFATQLGYYTTLRLHLQAPEPDHSAPPRGWHTACLKVYFYADPT